MAGGWTRDGAVQDQIDDTIKDAVLGARANMPGGIVLVHKLHHNMQTCIGRDAAATDFRRHLPGPGVKDDLTHGRIRRSARRHATTTTPSAGCCPRCAAAG